MNILCIGSSIWKITWVYFISFSLYKCCFYISMSWKMTKIRGGSKIQYSLKFSLSWSLSKVLKLTLFTFFHLLLNWNKKIYVYFMNKNDTVSISAPFANLDYNSYQRNWVIFKSVRIQTSDFVGNLDIPIRPLHWLDCDFIELLNVSPANLIPFPPCKFDQQDFALNYFSAKLTCATSRIYWFSIDRALERWYFGLVPKHGNRQCTRNFFYQY